MDSSISLLNTLLFCIHTFIKIWQFFEVGSNEILYPSFLFWEKKNSVSVVSLVCHGLNEFSLLLLSPKIGKKLPWNFLEILVLSQIFLRKVKSAFTIHCSLIFYQTLLKANVRFWNIQTSLLVFWPFLFKQWLRRYC